MPVTRPDRLLPKPAKFVFEPQPRPRKFLTVPNLMSIGRIFLLIPLFYALQKGSRENGNFWALVVMASALVSDMLDGMIARWFHVETDWGRVLDPLADKIWLGALAVFLALPTRENPLPVGFLLLSLTRDVLIVAGSYFVFRRKGLVVTSNYLGKVTMFVVALTLISYTVNWVPPVFEGFTPLTLVWTSSAFILLSGLQYLVRFFYYIRTTPLL
ncbi:MAG: CDP-alcohol phosphatidyltransferase family protein [Calditrichaeota bacterium]|nr:CDP-alcohol phosphatidyltransferase family protein [Calditrichota bacterium]MCB9391735.1 CDP-alcohol phosphatidyltransferase family protein [Calditrichota bacterium]